MMKIEKITALVPIKDSSERLANKNFRDFCGQPLYQVILEKLQKIGMVDRIIINTDSERVAQESVRRFSKVEIIPRPRQIIGHHVTMNTIIDYDLTQIEGEHFLQTHATNPLLSEKTITEAIEAYFRNLNIFDSLFTVFKVKKRGYDHKGVPINCSPKILEQTQHLPEILIENSNLFLFSRTSFLKAGNRIGLKPQHFSMNEIESADIDYEHEFILAELINKNKELFAGLN
jgi:CMP-N-acetylneuraminic acid synthetase